MASTIIHMAIAKELEDKLEIKDKKDYYLGSIAPDIAKQIGLKRNISHFSDNIRKGIPDLKLFIKRYPMFKYNSFNLGYFIHLYTDKIWDEDILNKIVSNNSIRLLDGTTIKSNSEEIKELVYSDYTNLNQELIEKYNLDLSLFYEKFKIPNTELKEIPVDRLDILINKMSIIIENSKQEKKYTIDMNIVNNFIERCTKEILEEIEKY